MSIYIIQLMVINSELNDYVDYIENTSEFYNSRKRDRYQRKP
ncbi:MAG: hypothetical protein ACJARP_002305 [Vicingaceae bacterium]|jgi:hypothetical protein